MKTFPNSLIVIALTEEEIGILNCLLRNCGGAGHLNRTAADMYYDMPSGPLDDKVELTDASRIKFETPGKKAVE